MHASRFFEWLGRIRRQDVTYFTTINNLGYLWINDTLSGLKTVPLVVVSFEFGSLRSSALSSDFPLYQLVLLNVKTETPSRFIQLIFHSMDFMQIFFFSFSSASFVPNPGSVTKRFSPEKSKTKGCKSPVKGRWQKYRRVKAAKWFMIFLFVFYSPSALTPLTLFFSKAHFQFEW